MKRILSLIIVVTMFLCAFSFSASAAENEEAKKLACFRVNWAAHSYYTTTYDETRTNDNYMKYYNVDKTSRYINSTGTTDYDGTGGGRAYFIQQNFAISNSTHYEYYFKAKNNVDKEYAGIVFAFGGGLAYIMYGSFNNTAEAPNTGVSSIKLTKGLHSSSSKDCSTGYEERFLKVELDKEGFGHYKIVYKGYDVSVYGLTNIEKGTYTQIGSSIKLPSDGEIALGVYARTEPNGPNRTVNLSDCLLYAMNAQAQQNISFNDDGSCRLTELITEAKTNYSEADNTAATYRDLQRAIEAAESLLKTWDFTASQLSEAEKNLEDALDQMEVNDADLTQLKAAIASFDALIAKEYTEISYKMVEQVVIEARALLTKESVRQSRVDYAAERIIDRMAMLVPSGYKAPNNDEVLETGSGSESSTVETGEESFERGCKSVVAGASVFAVAALIGISAFTVKKKED